MKKRILSLALAVCMMLSVMPTSFAAEGFLTLGGSDPVAEPEPEVQASSGVLTLGGSEESPEEDEEASSGVLTLDNDDTKEDEEPVTGILTPGGQLEDESPAAEDEGEPERPSGVLFYECPFCGYLDGSHADTCETLQPDEVEEEPIKVSAAARKPAIVYSYTYQDTFDALMNSVSLDEFDAILDELTGDQLDELYDLLTDEELDALDELEEALAREAAAAYERKDITKKVVTVEERATAFSEVTRKALMQLGYELVVNIFGWIVEDIDLPQNDYTMLEAISPEESVEYQWQILADDDLWVDIYNETGSIIRVSYAMVANLLDRDDAVQVRCEINSDEGVSYTDPVEVYVDYSSEDVIIDAEEEDAEEETPVEEAVVAEEPVMQTFALARTTSAASEPVAVMSLDTESTEEEISTAAEDDEPLVNHSVVINYVFENGEIVTDPYTASLAAGSNFSATVTFPVVQGYLPYVDLETESRASLELNITNIQDDETYTVTYKPTNVAYTVIHYWQNVDNDNYTEYARKTLQGLTGSTVPEVAESHAGFYALIYERPAIAADGSTVVEVYYDRYYYLMNFDLDGGYGVEPIYARYGAPIDNTAVPEKPGYTFAGWTLDGEKIVDIPATMPAESHSYTALWENPNTVNYTVVYWKENADDTNYSFWGSEIKTATAGSVVSGSDSVPESIHNGEKEYFTFNAARTDRNIVIAGDGTSVINVYYSRNYYTIIFYTNATECTLETHTHGDECYELGCGLENHTHSDECNQTVICPLTEHTHDAECCTREEHAEHTAECCTLTEGHTHSAVCYISTNNEGNNQRCYGDHNNVTAVEGVTYRHGNGGNNCVYYNGQWYRYNKNAFDNGSTNGLNSNTCPGSHTHGDGDCTCSQEIHVHGDGNCTCADTAHTHVESCYIYSCGAVAHTHDDDCIVLACTQFEHTHGDGYCSRNVDDATQYATYIITAKYEATIGEDWPTASDVDGLYGWSIDGTDSTQVSKVGTMTSDMCDTNDGVKRATASYGTSCLDHLYYMFESYNQSGPATTTHIYNETLGKWYDTDPVYSQDANSQGGNWSAKKITGVNNVRIETTVLQSETVEEHGHGGTVPTERNVYLYYDRLRYTLSFQNVDTVVKTVSNIMCGQSLTNYKDSDDNLLSAYELDDDDYPITALRGLYKFDGWYTTPECFDGTEFDFATATMPNNDLTLYAKWAPINHTVEFYLDKNTLDAGTKLSSHPDVTVAHGFKVDPVPAKPVNGNYDFVGWFYMDGQTEKAFDFANMAVTKDMKVYGKWSSDVLKEYTIYYKIQGTDTEIADPTTGSGLAGITKTFEAKGGTDLYANYQEGYFPVVKSHSLTLDINATEENDTNTFTFWYVQKEAVPYTVYYVTTENPQNDLGTVVLDGTTYYIVAGTKTVSDNRKAVVTEKFEVVPGYMPDAYQKRLIVDGTDGADNKIVFYYSVDTTHAYYKITHYTQNTDGQNWTEYASSQAVGVIGQTYSADPLTITGFRYDATVDGTVVSGELTASGLELKLYYVRNPYPYQVRYLENGTSKQLADPKNGTGLYGQVISENAINIPGYAVVGDSAKTCTIKIETGETAQLNIITFYYELALVDLTIQKEGCDETLDPDQTFIFHVVGTDPNTNKVNMTVVVTGDGSETIRDLPVGAYTITEDKGWSWRYDVTSVEIGETVIKNGAVELKESSTIVFTNERTNDKWFDSSVSCENVYVPATTSTGTASVKRKDEEN